MRKISILFVMIGLFLFNIAYAASVKEEYELQERCKKSVDTWFQKEWDGRGTHEDKDFVTMVDYQNHYNKKLHKCYILITSTEFIRNKENKIENIGLKTLFELNENKEYGSLIKFENDNKLINCRILEKYCNLEREWDLVVKPYMED